MLLDRTLVDCLETLFAIGRCLNSAAFLSANFILELICNENIIQEEKWSKKYYHHPEEDWLFVGECWPDHSLYKMGFKRYVLHASQWQHWQLHCSVQLPLQHLSCLILHSQMILIIICNNSVQGVFFILFMCSFSGWDTVVRIFSISTWWQ